MGKLFLLVLMSFSMSSHAYELSGKMHKMVGQTFSKPGPNCFAAALYGADVYDSIRGISENEFAAVLKTACKKVETPRFGDVGVYNAKGFGFVHAFTYLDADTAFEKPGVDYVGKTPVRVQGQVSVDYVHIASPECRRWGDESCHNQKSYYRCGAVKLNSKFKFALDQINSLFDAVLIKGDLFFAVRNEIFLTVETLEALAASELEKSILESIEKQMHFFGFEPSKMLIL